MTKLIVGLFMFTGSLYGMSYVTTFYKGTWFDVPTCITLTTVFCASIFVIAAGAMEVQND